MKLFKWFLPIILVTTLVIFFINKLSISQIDPISNKNDFFNKLDNALQTSQITPINLTVRDYINEVEFYIQNNNSNSKVIVSTKKDPYWQIASLQDLLKTAIISNRQVNLVDLSVDHPYATFKNN